MVTMIAEEHDDDLFHDEIHVIWQRARRQKLHPLRSGGQPARLRTRTPPLKEAS